MRIVLLGATGFVGSHLLPELASRGHQCTVLCRNASRSRDLLLIPGVDLRQVTAFTSTDLVSEFAGADAVINLVGILNERGRSGRGFRTVHEELTANLIEACRITGVRRVVQFSALNAGKGKSHYLISKGKAEDLLRQAEFLEVAIIRPSVIFGAGDSFFNRFAALLRLMPVLPLACPQSKLQPVWVGDVVNAVGCILQSWTRDFRSYDLVGPRVYTLKELVEYTARVLDKRRWIIGLPGPLARLQGFIMDFVPGKPFSSDNYQSLQLDNVSTSNALPELGIRPRSVKAEVPGYLVGSPRQSRLDRWRRHPTPEKPESKPAP
jgi:NADH dehydrogenase